MPPASIMVNRPERTRSRRHNVFWDVVKALVKFGLPTAGTLHARHAIKEFYGVPPPEQEFQALRPKDA